ncbi:MAG: LpxI family protein, partial [Hyphomicrobiaceae bacterium]
QSGGSVHIVAIDPSADPDLDTFPHHRISLGQVGRLISILREQRCNKIVIVGSLSRPDFATLRLDFGFFTNLGKILRLLRGGDDTVLRQVILFFESHGFEVLGLADVAPGLLTQSGLLVPPNIPETELAGEIAKGLGLIRQLGHLDVGQAVVVREGRITAIEAAEGTDAMLQRLADRSPDCLQTHGVLIKAAKPEQDLRVDLPTIGPLTIQMTATAKLAAIALEARRSVIADRLATLDDARNAGIGVMGVMQGEQHCKTAMGPEGMAETMANISRRRPSRSELSDIALGCRVLDILVAKDVESPSVVVNRGYVLAVGADEEFVNVVQRARTRRQWGDRGPTRAGIAILQDAELLTLAAIEAAVRARLRGIVCRKPVEDSIGSHLIEACDAHRLILLMADS